MRRSPTTTSSPSRTSRSPACAAPRTAGGPSTRPRTGAPQKAARAAPGLPRVEPLAPGAQPHLPPPFQVLSPTQRPCQGLAPPTLPPEPSAAPAPHFTRLPLAHTRTHPASSPLIPRRQEHIYFQKVEGDVRKPGLGATLVPHPGLTLPNGPGAAPSPVPGNPPAHPKNGTPCSHGGGLAGLTRYKELSVVWSSQTRGS
ncbi:Hypothetical predicted protein [Lynx pardinus]|uniref:Uncharacterized protein n=1 Tax=Lynx pardinus TaxID=191816 RepID=A0A485MUF5_LYNPA|nr:Hypothetical predicted protein [Lynx pardinus]